jgi:hypothetical protein
MKINELTWIRLTSPGHCDRKPVTNGKGRLHHIADVEPLGGPTVLRISPPDPASTEAGSSSKIA